MSKVKNKEKANLTIRLILLLILVLVSWYWYIQLPRDSLVKEKIQDFTLKTAQKKVISSKNSVGIMFTYGVAGYLEPCGCSAKQLGGLPQRAYQLEQKRKSITVLPIDGGYLVEDGHIFDQLRFKVAIKMMKMMGYKALGISRYELQLPIEFMREQYQYSKIPFLSANVLLANSESPIVQESEFDELNQAILKIIKSSATVKNTLAGKELRLYTTPATIVEINGIKFGITNFTYPYLKGKSLDKFIVYDPQFTASSIIKEIKKHCDYLIVMTEGPFNTVKTIIDNNKEINLFLTGVDNSFEAGIGAVPNYQFKWANSNDIGKHFIFCAIKPTHNRFSNIITAEEIPDLKFLPEYRKIYDDEYKSKLKELFFNQDFIVPAFNYVPPSTCSSCHLRAFNVYKNSKHIHSLETLKQKKSEFNPDCVGCHVVIDEKSGDFHPIICQTCHSKITTEHTTLAMSGKIPPRTETNMSFSYEWCAQKCHNPENSKDFAKKYPEYIKKFFHGLDEKTPYGKGLFYDSKPKPYPLQ